MEPHRKHRRIEQNYPSSASTLMNSYSKVFLAFFVLQVQTPFRILSSCTTSFVEPHCCSTVQHWCLDENVEAMSSSFLLLFLVWWTFLSLVLVGHSTGKKHETMKRRQIHHVLRHRAVSMQVRGRKSAPFDRHLHDQKQPWTRHESRQSSQFLFNYEALSCRKVIKTF